MFLDEKNNVINQDPDCLSHDYEALSVGCSGSHEMEFKSSCSQPSSYSCHGSWEENGVSYVIATPLSRKSNEAPRYCLIYTLANQVSPTVIEGSLGKDSGPPILRLSGVTESCHRSTVPGVTGEWAFNFTSNGKWKSILWQVCLIFYVFFYLTRLKKPSYKISNFTLILEIITFLRV